MERKKISKEMIGGGVSRWSQSESAQKRRPRVGVCSFEKGKNSETRDTGRYEPRTERCNRPCQVTEEGRDLSGAGGGLYTERKIRREKGQSGSRLWKKLSQLEVGGTRLEGNYLGKIKNTGGYEFREMVVRTKKNDPTKKTEKKKKERSSRDDKGKEKGGALEKVLRSVDYITFQLEEPANGRNGQKGRW